MRISQKSILVFTFLILILTLSSLPSFSFTETSNYPLTVIDHTGTAVTILQEPERIISAAPSNTEILFALGLGDKVVGVTNYDNYPEEVAQIEKIGEMSPLNLEKIVALKPDLILAYAVSQGKEILRLRELGFKVIDVDPSNLEETFQSIMRIATICGVPERGESLVQELSGRVEKIKAKVSQITNSKRPKVFIGSTFEPIWTAGANTLCDELITLAGGQNIAGSSSSWIAISPELVAQAEPDIIIIPTGAMNPGEESKIKENISQRPGWSNLPAIKNQKIFIVNEDLFYRAGPRSVEALEWLYEIFHQ